MENLKIVLAGVAFDARLETAKAPATCAASLKHLPFRNNGVSDLSL